jgi:hypothetical protein
MAKLTGTLPFPTTFGSTAQDDEFEKLKVASAALPPGQVVGFLMEFAAADSYAYYLVTRETKAGLEVMHVPYCDAWTVSPALIRGLTRRDVLAQREFQMVFGHSIAR